MLEQLKILVGVAVLFVENLANGKGVRNSSRIRGQVSQCAGHGHRDDQDDRKRDQKFLLHVFLSFPNVVYKTGKTATHVRRAQARGLSS